MSFEEHIKSEHNMWHYLYFLVLVRVKDPTEYTGPESYVAQMIAVSTPLQTALTVQTSQMLLFSIQQHNRDCTVVKMHCLKDRVYYSKNIWTNRHINFTS